KTNAARVVTRAEWRRRLGERLPAYMVPAMIVSLERMPLTANGKVDRKALQNLEWNQIDDTEEHKEPRTPIEATLAGIWREVLKLDRVGVRDSFFELGGHSLLGTQVISSVRTAFGIDLPLVTLFQAPTVEQMAAEVLEAMTRDQDLGLLDEMLAELETPA
ncbi:MAG TPA: phosphopantetheine-binding protein, partial [Blastocatellia bacterium]|nr:phosphopantetheine-binding protein [Blastocatellia bacterium]